MKECGYNNGDEVFVIVEGKDNNTSIKLYNMRNHKDHQDSGSDQIANNENKDDIFRMTRLDSNFYFIQGDMTGLPLIRKDENFKEVPILIGNLATNVHQGPSSHGTKLKIKINFPYQNVQ